MWIISLLLLLIPIAGISRLTNDSFHWWFACLFLEQLRDRSCDFNFLSGCWCLSSYSPVRREVDARHKSLILYWAEYRESPVYAI